jgi:hypothetical protein
MLPVLLFVFWYCHKRGRETRIDKERLAAQEGESTRASSASSFTDDNDSIFGDRKDAQAESSKNNDKQAEKLESSTANEAEPSKAKLEDMPSVKDLPDPGKGKEKAY